MVLGGILVIALLVGIGFYVSPNFITSDEIQVSPPADSGIDTAAAVFAAEQAANTVTGFTLSKKQRQTLSSFGIDSASVPAIIPAEQEACLVATLGATKVAEIKAGGIPSAPDLFQAKGCI